MPDADMSPEPLRIGNCSGFYGDRLAAMREMLEGGPLDVLTGDYLAELTMLILARAREKKSDAGYATTFLRQLEECLGLMLEHGVKIVTNAGGLNPTGLADKIRELGTRLGCELCVAHVEGDNLKPRAAELGIQAKDDGTLLAANAYLGGFGIAECLRAGADVVVTGRVTDASLVVGPGVWHFGWTHDDLDALAGAMVAGHAIECGAHVTGGNYSFFEELPNLGALPGFPIAELHADGSSVITKHSGTGGAVTVDTVTAQMLYEIQGPEYAGPDATARIDTIRLASDGPDRVRITGVRGMAAPSTTKVSVNGLARFRNEVEFVLCGLDIDGQAQLVEAQLEATLKQRPAQLTWTLARTDQKDAPTQEQASARLRVVAEDIDPQIIGRTFSSAAVELALSSYPGAQLTGPPTDASPVGSFVPAFVANERIEHVAVLPDGTRTAIVCGTATVCNDTLDGRQMADPEWVHVPDVPDSPAIRAPLGTVVGARSGDKGGDATLGLWARNDDAYAWLRNALSVDRLRELLPEIGNLAVGRFPLPNLRAILFVIEGFLGDGVASQARFDPQAKALGEWLRSRYMDIPKALVQDSRRKQRAMRGGGRKVTRR